MKISKTDFQINPIYSPIGTKSVPNQEAFYFRISGNNIFYTQSDTDLKVLGALAVHKIEPIQDSYMRKNCFSVSNQQDRWMLCPCHENDKSNQWIELLTNQTKYPSNLQAQPPDLLEKNETNSNNNTNPVLKYIFFNLFGKDCSNDTDSEATDIINPFAKF